MLLFRNLFTYLCKSFLLQIKKIRQLKQRENKPRARNSTFFSFLPVLLFSFPVCGAASPSLRNLATVFSLNLDHTVFFEPQPSVELNFSFYHLSWNTDDIKICQSNAAEVRCNFISSISSLFSSQSCAVYDTKLEFKHSLRIFF